MSMVDINPRVLLALLEAEADRQDATMGRMIEMLRELIDDREAMEAMQLRQVQVQATRSAFIVEAAMCLREAEDAGASVIALGRYRRPSLRVVQ